MVKSELKLAAKNRIIYRPKGSTVSEMFGKTAAPIEADIVEVSQNGRLVKIENTRDDSRSKWLELDTIVVLDILPPPGESLECSSCRREAGSFLNLCEWCFNRKLQDTLHKHGVINMQADYDKAFKDIRTEMTGWQNEVRAHRAALDQRMDTLIKAQVDQAGTIAEIKKKVN